MDANDAVRVTIPHICANCALWNRYQVLHRDCGDCLCYPMALSKHEGDACGSWQMMTKRQLERREIVFDLPCPEWQEDDR